MIKKIILFISLGFLLTGCIGQFELDQQSKNNTECPEKRK